MKFIEHGADRRAVAKNMDGYGDAAATGQHDIEKRRSFAKQDVAIRAFANSVHSFAGHSRFDAATGDETAITTIIADRHMCAERAGRATPDLYKRGECNACPAVETVNREPQYIYGTIGGKCLFRYQGPENCLGYVGHSGTTFFTVVIPSAQAAPTVFTGSLSLDELFQSDRQIADTLAGCMEDSIGDGWCHTDNPNFADPLAAKHRGLVIRHAH